MCWLFPSLLSEGKEIKKGLVNSCLDPASPIESTCFQRLHNLLVPNVNWPDLECEVLSGFFYLVWQFRSNKPVSLHILFVTCLQWKNKIIIFHLFKVYSHLLKMSLPSSFRGSVLYLWKWILCWHLNCLDLVSQRKSTSILNAMLWITFCTFC